MKYLLSALRVLVGVSIFVFTLSVIMIILAMIGVFGPLSGGGDLYFTKGVAVATLSWVFGKLSGAISIVFIIFYAIVKFIAKKRFN